MDADKNFNKNIPGTRRVGIILSRDLPIGGCPPAKIDDSNNIAPGAIETLVNRARLNDPVKIKPLLEYIPPKRLGTPEDVAGVAAFLASGDSDYVTSTTFFGDGGLL